MALPSLASKSYHSLTIYFCNTNASIPREQVLKSIRPHISLHGTWKIPLGMPLEAQVDLERPRVLHRSQLGKPRTQAWPGGERECASVGSLSWGGG